MVAPVVIEPIRIFLGWDARESVAYHVCVQSILAKASRPVAIYPLALHLFSKEYQEHHDDGSNAFTYSRFLIPWLCHWNGYAIFMEADMLMRADIAELWDMRRPDLGVQCVQHDYKTKHPDKYLGAKNEDYPRKNWSSVMLWNCGYFPNRVLDPKFVGDHDGSFLHRFGWLSDEQIGELPKAYNHLVGEFDRDDMAKLLHFTIGTPCFPGYEQQEGADEWRDTLADAMQPLKV